MASPVSNSVPLLTPVNNNDGILIDEFISGLAQSSSWQLAPDRVITYSLNINDDGHAEQEARLRKWGLWSHPDPVPPWDWRRNTKHR